MRGYYLVPKIVILRKCDFLFMGKLRILRSQVPKVVLATGDQNRGPVDGGWLLLKALVIFI